MKFDTVIIGGGLSGLACGIRLQKKGVKCAIISAGQSALHFSSGSFELLNRLPDGTAVENPVEAVAKLEASHPYKKSEISPNMHPRQNNCLPTVVWKWKARQRKMRCISLRWAH